MPELPELEVVREVLTRRVVGRRLQAVHLDPRGGPIVVRDLTHLGLSRALTGALLTSVRRRGKFLLFSFEAATPLLLIINPKLSGRLQLCPPGEKKGGPVHVTLLFAGPEEHLRYIDSKRMGQVYLTRIPESVPTFHQMGPEPLDISPEEFRQRLLGLRGEIKGILTRGLCVAGIGNAYADEILWQARLHPFRKRATLSEHEIAALHHAMHTTLRAAISRVRQEMGEAIHLEPRGFFAVHLRAGQPCPRCGSEISVIHAKARFTNFCRACQPGGLIAGM